jgi:hypothetical protein
LTVTLPIRPGTMPRRCRSAPAGLHHPQDHVDITVQARHDGECLSCLSQWAAPDVSSKRSPLLNTAQGWQVLHTKMEQDEEETDDADKLAM